MLNDGRVPGGGAARAPGANDAPLPEARASEARAIETRAIEAFRLRFGASPAVIASAPGRVNLIGEHVDYADGVVLPMAIAERTAVAMGAAGDASEIESLELERGASTTLPARFEALPPDHADAWTNAVMGPLRELVDAGIRVPPIRAVIASDVPIGAGVSSSAALATAMVAAALRLAGTGAAAARQGRHGLAGTERGAADLGSVELARLLQRAERRFVGTPCGIMDMLTAIAARPGMALRLDCRSLEIEAIELPSSISLLLVDSGVRHSLARTEYGTRRAEVEEAAARLRLRSLRDCTMDQLASAALPELLLRRATHVVREIERVDRAVEALRRRDAETFGRLVSESHASLRDLFEVSAPAVDRVVAAAEAADAGVLGARMVGGGFGGSVLVVARADRAREVEEALRRRGLDAPPHSMRLVRAGSGYTSALVETPS